MMSPTIMLELQLEGREATGKALKPHRKEGKLPVVIYGTGVTPGNYFIDTIAFTKVWREAGETTLVSLNADGKKKEALIHDVAIDPLLRTPIHVDFLLVDANKPVEVSVELVFEGVAPVVKNLGGVFGQGFA